MLIGDMSDVQAFLQTTPLIPRHDIGAMWTLDDDSGWWEVHVIPLGADEGAEGLVFARSRDGSRGALIGIASSSKVMAVRAELSDQPSRSLRDLALLLQRDTTSPV